MNTVHIDFDMRIISLKLIAKRRPEACKARAIFDVCSA